MKALSALRQRAATVVLALGYLGAASAAPIAGGNDLPDYHAWFVTIVQASDTASHDRAPSLGTGVSTARLWPRGVAVREPGALTLLAAGFATVLIARRRRRKTQ